MNLSRRIVVLVSACLLALMVYAPFAWAVDSNPSNPNAQDPQKIIDDAKKAAEDAKKKPSDKDNPIPIDCMFHMQILMNYLSQLSERSSSMPPGEAPVAPSIPPGCGDDFYIS